PLTRLDAGERRLQYFLPPRLGDRKHRSHRTKFLPHQAPSVGAPARFHPSQGILPDDGNMPEKDNIPSLSLGPYLSANSSCKCFHCVAALLKLLRVGGVSPNTYPGIGASVPPNRRSPLPQFRYS